MNNLILFLTSKNSLRIIVPVFLLIIVLVAIQGYLVYTKIHNPNIDLKGEKHVYIYIPSGSNFADFKKNIKEMKILLDEKKFFWTAEKKELPNNLKAGRYKITDKMSNNELINMLRSGKQSPVKVTINTVRTKQRLAQRVASKIEADSSEIIALLTSEEVAMKYGFKNETFICMFIPNTYFFEWNTSPERFIQRMASEYKRFWNDDRKAKAKKIGLSQSEVSTLASIVQAEQSRHHDEKPTIAGLYINRLKKKMLLQSDPTIIFAIGDFSIRRVLNKDKKFDSKYNTYMYRGLPPGPINMPDISSIDAVLNYEEHKYLFMCAKEDFSGYHYFSKTMKQHQIYARKYQRALNKQRTWR